eukprot:TRINITY_DN68743_c0_g1_i1.p1 TRINITY_DN68743_c0_g1~~TRINITY_DN68743_c0_g1_i1.p1  ORF type:complete len:780 (+),score=95.20 TRINITY_DN68743_c0_g1_i1:82-2421(+)
MLIIAICALSVIRVSAVRFRPPAIPLVTTDPYMQTWIRGDNSTSVQVTHWYGEERQMMGYVRVDGKLYQWLGSLNESLTKPGPVSKKPGRDIVPGLCDIGGANNLQDADCNVLCYNTPKCMAYVIAGDKCFLKSCTSPLADSDGHDAFVITGEIPSRKHTHDVVQQRSVHVLPTRTVFQFYVADTLSLNVTFLSTLFTDDFVQLSRPVSYVDVDIASRDGKSHSVQVYLDMSAQHVVNSCQTQKVSWKAWTQEEIVGVQMGVADQNTVDLNGDRNNLDWGYLHLAFSSNASEHKKNIWAGSADVSRSAFKASGGLPVAKDEQQPRICAEDMPVLAVVADIRATTVSRRQTFMIAYDDVDSVKFYDDKLKAYWTQRYPDIQHALIEAARDLNYMRRKSQVWDQTLFEQVIKYGQKYTFLMALAYRQTLAANKLVWNSKLSVMWNFQKELSTNGNMQTMDVIYPASPMFLYTNPDLLKAMLQPILAFANNETKVPFRQQYSPHQLGVYPIADANTEDQEDMPLENSGNMFLMLLAIVQRKHDSSWFYPRYWPMLQTWADVIAHTSEYPATQICTDDFEGPLPNNTNLGAKGIIALEAFAELCRLTESSTDCGHYSEVAKRHAQTWQEKSFTSKPSAHYKLSYNDLPEVPDSWSLKYNLLWQKLLKLDGPFPWDEVVPIELAYYKTKSNLFGVPMDPRHQYVKSDWLSWIAAMAEEEHDFHFFFDPIFDELNVTVDRHPFTDLYHTDTALQDRADFIARPVVGAIFAKMLVSDTSKNCLAVY